MWRARLGVGVLSGLFCLVEACVGNKKAPNSAVGAGLLDWGGKVLALAYAYFTADTVVILRLVASHLLGATSFLEPVTFVLMVKSSKVAGSLPFVSLVRLVTCMT